MLTLRHTAPFMATHIESRLPFWHECAKMHGHIWTVALEVSHRTGWTDDKGVEIHTAFGLFDRWVGAYLNHHHLNDIGALGERCSATDVARWIYNRWSGRVPYLAAVRVTGPTRMVGGPVPPPLSARHRLVRLMLRWLPHSPFRSYDPEDSYRLPRQPSRLRRWLWRRDGEWTTPRGQQLYRRVEYVFRPAAPPNSPRPAGVGCSS
jgi:6-pyruvoyltetrahydropterin/6-carboxytetrahydropterin synthase